MAACKHSDLVVTTVTTVTNVSTVLQVLEFVYTVFCGKKCFGHSGHVCGATLSEGCSFPESNSVWIINETYIGRC